MLLRGWRRRSYNSTWKHRYAKLHGLDFLRPSKSYSIPLVVIHRAAQHGFSPAEKTLFKDEFFSIINGFMV